MHLCPHCEERGIGFFAKMLSNPVYPAVCRLCGRSSTKCAKVIWIQIWIAAAYLAIVPNLAPAETAYLLASVTGLVVIAVGQIGHRCAGSTRRDVLASIAGARARTSRRRPAASTPSGRPRGRQERRRPPLAGRLSLRAGEKRDPRSRSRARGGGTIAFRGAKD